MWGHRRTLPAVSIGLNKMKINFTKNEYRLLLELIYLGQWMVEAHEIDESPETEKYEMLIQKIYSHASEMGCTDLIEPAESLSEYYPTLSFEEGKVFDYIDEYNNETFWDELIRRLAERDVQVELTVKNIAINSVDEMWKISTPFEEKYAREFQEHGVTRLVVRGS